MIANNKYKLFRLRALLSILFFVAGISLNAQEQAAYVVSSGGGYSSGGTYTQFSTTGGGVVKDQTLGGSFDKSIGFLYNSNIFIEVPEYNLFAESFPANAGVVVGAGIYNEGDSIAVSATSNAGFTFIGWGAPSGRFFDVNDSTTFFFMPGEEAMLTAYFAEVSDEISISEILAAAFPETGGQISGSGEYLNGTSITLNANPAEGYRFVSWTESDVIVSTNPEYTFEVGSNRNLVANYALEEYTVTVAASPASNIGGSVLGGGTFTYGTEISIMAFTNLGFDFQGWKEKGIVVDTNTTYTFVVTEDMNFTGLFDGQKFNITTSVAPADSAGSAAGGGEYYFGDIVSVEATPEKGHYFVRWMDGDQQVSVRNPYLFSALEDRDLVAEFGVQWWEDDTTAKNDQWLVTAETTPSEVGIVLGQGFYNDAETVTLTASPNNGINFIKWTKDGVDVLDGNNELVGPEYTFTAGENLNLVAVFDGDMYQVEATANPEAAGTVSVSNEGSFFPGDLAVLNADVNAGYVFRNWSLGADGPQLSVLPEYRFTVKEDRQIVANYDELPKYNLSITVVPEGAATVSGAGDYTTGAEASIGVVPAEGYTFRYWSEATELISRATDTMLMVDRDLSINAVLELKTFNVSYDAGENGMILGSMDQLIDYGTDAEPVTAMPDSCYEFVQWSDGVTLNPRTDLGVMADLNVSAIFAEKQVDAGLTLEGETLTANIEVAAFQWIQCDNGNAVIEGATGRSFTPTVSGTYAVMILDNNCEVMSECITVTVSGATSVANGLSDQFGFEVYPNPARERFIVSAKTEASFVIVNSLGQQISRFELNTLNGFSTSVEGLESGVYMIVGRMGDQVQSRRVIMTE